MQKQENIAIKVRHGYYKTKKHLQLVIARKSALKTAMTRQSLRTSNHANHIGNLSQGLPHRFQRFAMTCRA